MKTLFPILILDSQDSPYNSLEFTKLTGLDPEPSDLHSSSKEIRLITNLNKLLLHKSIQEFSKEICLLLKEPKVVLLIHRDMIEKSKMGVIEFLKGKCGTLIEFHDETFTVLELKSKRKGFQKSIHSKSVTPSVKVTESVENVVARTGLAMNITRSENANKARSELVLPHTKIIENKGLIHYSHDLLDALDDDEDDDLDF